MRQAYTGIPTEYAGVRFRSRLEAKWAAFFDLCEWTWEYEPFDLNGWIPDFRLGCSSRPLLVEVKPVSSLSDSLAQDAIAKMKATEECPVDRPFGRYDYLLLGDAPPKAEHMLNADVAVAIGWGPDHMLCQWTVLSCHRIALRSDEYCHGGDPDPAYEPIGLISTEGSYHDRITNHGAGDHHLVYDSRLPALIDRFWKRACNQTQWKRP